MAVSNNDIIIVGAGLAGLGLALALNSRGISCRVYEQAPSTGRVAGAINLSPNSLRILDQYGIYGRIAEKGFHFKYIDWQDSQGRSINHQHLGSKEHFQYDALRIYRKAVVQEIQNAVRERGVSIHFNKKFSGIIEEMPNSVTVEFQDGSQTTGSLLIAADGIHSKIRNLLYPEVQPVYNGMLVVAGSVKRSDVATQGDQEILNPLTQLSPAGAFILATQKPDGSELLAGTQMRYPEQDRQGWDTIAKDPGLQQQLLERGLEGHSELISSAIKHISDDSRYIWPQRVLSHLPKWTSEQGRIIIIGDAAHAIPPLTGQGANQAFEDGYSLAIVLSRNYLGLGNVLPTALHEWQEIRQQRMERVLDFTRKVSNMWLPAEAKAKLRSDEIWQGVHNVGAMSWLYAPNLDEDFRASH